MSEKKAEDMHCSHVRISRRCTIGLATVVLAFGGAFRRSAIGKLELTVQYHLMFACNLRPSTVLALTVRLVPNWKQLVDAVAGPRATSSRLRAQTTSAMGAGSQAGHRRQSAFASR